MTDDERARELLEQGTKRLSDGQVEEAVELFEQSIAVKPTAGAAATMAACWIPTQRAAKVDPTRALRQE